MITARITTVLVLSIPLYHYQSGGSGPPWKWWRGMDRVNQRESPQLPSVPTYPMTENRPSVSCYRQSCKRAYYFGDGWNNNGAK